MRACAAVGDQKGNEEAYRSAVKGAEEISVDGDVAAATDDLFRDFVHE